MTQEQRELANKAANEEFEAALANVKTEPAPQWIQDLLARDDVMS